MLPAAPPFIAIYTDEDVTSALAPALRRRGYRAESALEAENLAIRDEEQLIYATSQSMALLTYNAQDFVPIAREWYFAGREHGGLIISRQFSQREFGELLRRVLRLLDTARPNQVFNQILFLQEYRS